jgi:hypothetical protein
MAFPPSLRFITLKVYRIIASVASSRGIRFYGSATRVPGSFGGLTIAVLILAYKIVGTGKSAGPTDFLD